MKCPQDPRGAQDQVQSKPGADMKMEHVVQICCEMLLTDDLQSQQLDGRF